jgi:hypothetical protein
MATPIVEDVSIDALGAPMRELVDGMHGGSVKLLREKDGTPRAVVIDAETYDQLLHPQDTAPSAFSVDEVIGALESLREGAISEEEGRRLSQERLERVRRRAAEAQAKG